MRRLFAAIYNRLLGIRITTAWQHIEDLTKMHDDLVKSRQTIDAEIAHLEKRMTEANRHLDMLMEQKA